MTKDNNFLAYLYLFLTVTFWAGNFVVGKLASFYEVPPFSLNFYRWLFAWLILAPFTIPEILEKKNYIIKNDFDLVLTIDSPDFNYNLVNQLRKSNYMNKIIFD